MKSGPIIIVEDDADDESIMEEVFKEINVTNKVIWFQSCISALHYLKTTSDHPFIIFSDVNLPGQTGIEFKKQIDADADLRRKSIPFVFYSTSVDQATVNEAYTKMTVQGFFQKKNDYEKIKKNLKLILDYWEDCQHPNTM